MSETSWSEQAKLVHGGRLEPGERSASTPPDVHPDASEFPSSESGSESAHALPQPTVWPAALAFGITLLAGSLTTSIFVAIAGLVLIAVALRGWIHELVEDAVRDSDALQHGEHRG
jgi:hypothetical protein